MTILPGVPSAPPAGADEDQTEATLLMRVTCDGRIVRTRSGAHDEAGAGGGRTFLLPLAAAGESLVPWIASAVGADRREGDPAVSSAPLVLVIRRGPDPSEPALLIAARRHASGPDPADHLAPAPPGPAGRPRRLVGFKRRRMFLFDPNRVLCFELRAGLVHAQLEDGESYTTNYSIRELAARLASADFFRVHRDVVVNLAKVREIERAGEGRLRLLLDTADARGLLASRPASARLRRLLRF